jgi:hypothetical protein
LICRNAATSKLALINSKTKEKMMLMTTKTTWVLAPCTFVGRCQPALFFLKKMFQNAKSDPKFGQRGVALVISVPGKIFMEHRSGLRPEKELLEWCSLTKVLLMPTLQRSILSLSSKLK